MKDVKNDPTYVLVVIAINIEVIIYFIFIPNIHKNLYYPSKTIKYILLGF